jgi:hypothetical protein
MITIQEFPKNQQDNVLLIKATNEENDSWMIFIRVVKGKFEISVTEGLNLLFAEQAAFFTMDPSLPTGEHNINLHGLSEEDIARVEKIIDDYTQHCVNFGHVAYVSQEESHSEDMAHDKDENKQEEKQHGFYSKMSFKQPSHKKNRLEDLAKDIYTKRHKLWDEAIFSVPLDSKMPKVFNRYIEILDRYAKDSCGIHLYDLLQNSKAISWFQKSSKLATVYRLIISSKIKFENSSTQGTAEKTKHKVSDETVRKARQRAEEHFAKKQGYKTQLEALGVFAVNLRDKNAVNKMAKKQLMKAHPDKGGNNDKAGFFLRLMEDNNNDLLPPYLDELDSLEKEKMGL